MRRIPMREAVWAVTAAASCVFALQGCGRTLGIGSLSERPEAGADGGGGGGGTTLEEAGGTGESGGSGTSGGSGGSSGDGSSGGGGTGAVGLSTCTASNQCTDFPTAPVFDSASSVAPNAASLFTGTPSTSGGPCLYEPQDQTLFPNGGTITQSGWVRPRISWTPASGQDVFQITLSAPQEKGSYVIYTTNTYWTMDKPTWLSLSQNFVGTPGGDIQIAVTVAGTSSTGGTITASPPAHFTIASLPASGALIYWATQNFSNTLNSTELKGFQVGDEATTVALQSSQVQQTVVASETAPGVTTDPVPSPYETTCGDPAEACSQPVPVECIGCHTATPDGLYVAFNAQWPWPSALAALGTVDGGAGGAVGSQPPWLTTGAIANLNPLGPLKSIDMAESPLNPSTISANWFNPPIVNQMMLGMQTFSAGHYSDSDRKLVTTLGSTQDAFAIDTPDIATGVVSQLAWIDLQWTGTPSPVGAGLPVAPCGTDPPPPAPGTTWSAPVAPAGGQSGAAGPCLAATNGGTASGWGIVQRTGDSNSAGAPSWSHNNSTGTGTDVIAYTSVGSGGVKDGRLESGPGDIWTVPYNGGNGGPASALPGASSSSVNEYYPSWSPDDQLIAFNVAPSTALMYNQPLAEVWVIPYNNGAGGTAVRLAGNDPVACTGAANAGPAASPGVQNTWPRWAPLPETTTAGMAGNQGADGKLYYWVTFSSTRADECSLRGATGGVCHGPASSSTTEAADAVGRAQLYVAAVVVDPSMNNQITTYPAIYMWNQDPGLNNLIPSWGFFPVFDNEPPPVK
jgi:hypothetical protein